MARKLTFSEMVKNIEIDMANPVLIERRRGVDLMGEHFETRTYRLGKSGFRVEWHPISPLLLTNGNR